MQAHLISSLFVHSVLPLSVVMKTFEAIGLSFIFRRASAHPASFCLCIFSRFFFSAAMEVCCLFSIPSSSESICVSANSGEFLHVFYSLLEQ